MCIESEYGIASNFERACAIYSHGLALCTHELTERCRPVGFAVVDVWDGIPTRSSMTVQLDEDPVTGEPVAFAYLWAGRCEAWLAQHARAFADMVYYYAELHLNDKKHGGKYAAIHNELQMLLMLYRALLGNNHILVSHII